MLQLTDSRASGVDRIGCKRSLFSLSRFQRIRVVTFLSNSIAWKAHLYREELGARGAVKRREERTRPEDRKESGQPEDEKTFALFFNASHRGLNNKIWMLKREIELVHLRVVHVNETKRRPRVEHMVRHMVRHISHFS